MPNLDLADVRHNTTPVLVVIVYYILFATAVGLTAISMFTVVQRRSSGVLGDPIVDTIFAIHILDTLLLFGPLVGILTGLYLQGQEANNRFQSAVQAGTGSFIGFIVLIVTIDALATSYSSVDLILIPQELPLLVQISVPTALAAAISGYIGPGTYK